MKPTTINQLALGFAVAAILTTSSSTGQSVAIAVSDPGVRGGAAAAGTPLQNLSTRELLFFNTGLADFAEAEGVAEGLGPRFNLDSCAGCHLQPSIGGSSPRVNPQVALATAFGARNSVPSFVTTNGPVREVRYKQNADGSRDGGVHSLFVISGRVDSTGSAVNCNATQEDFETQVANGNAIFRIPTPVFGTGLMEQIADKDILDNLASNRSQKQSLGIGGHVNRNGNDGTISRFGWKAQNQSLMVFSGEAYNVEMGITNEVMQSERDQSSRCQFAQFPNDTTDVDGISNNESISAVEKFSFFMRLLAPPTPSATMPGGADSIGRGRQKFTDVGCAHCHTPTFRTGNTAVAAMRNQNVNLYSDLALHQMGPRLADNIQQGGAKGDEFRTAPLWGLGQRIFFLHDGRTKDLIEAIQAHRSGANSENKASEANTVVDNYNALGSNSKQDLLNFLRSL